MRLEIPASAKRQMSSLRLRSKFLLSLLLISAGLTCGTLLMVRHTVNLQLRREIGADLRNSVSTFKDFQQQREIALTRSAELLANLPSLKALMTSQDAATIQDASADLWRLAGSDLFVLASREGRIMALHTATPGFTRSAAQDLLQRSAKQDQPGYWWYGGGHLYQVFLQPIYFGAPSNNSPLGILAVGYEIDDGIAREVGRIASSQVAFRYQDLLVVSTLTPEQQSELGRQPQFTGLRAAADPAEIDLGGEKFLGTSVELAPSSGAQVYLTVLKSYDQATAFLTGLNRSLLALGFVAVAAGSLLVFLISDTFTRPLATLVEGVRALEKGNFGYPLQAHGRDEVAELTGAFDRMRKTLNETQQQLLDAERLATIGRMASSISHDLRHPLTAVLANSEFLCEPGLTIAQREEFYQEIRVAVDRMTDLVESLLEFSRAREHLRPVYGRMEETVRRAVSTVQAHPEFSRVNISLSCEGRGEGWFDPRKMERVFQNLLLNACEAVPSENGKIEVSIREANRGLEIRVADNGPGIPEPIRDILFEPFVSYGKEKGTGLGLTVVQKIFQDHGGNVLVESTQAGRTVFKLVLPAGGLSDMPSAR